MREGRREGQTRILQVVDGMYRAGLETWLMHILRHIDRERYRMDFLVQDFDEAHYDREIRSLGSEVIPCIPRYNLPKHTCDFRRILREHGPYDVVHAHYHFYNGYALELARRAGVPVRITHSHNDTSGPDSEGGIGRRAFIKAARYLQSRNATEGIAVSEGAARALFGKDWHKDPRWSILYTSIVPERFEGPVDRAAVRREFGVAKDAFVVGHVGRFMKQKNHRFLVEIFAEISRRDPEARLVLVGAGPLQEEVEGYLKSRGVRDKTVMAGVHPDPERLMRGLMDVFVLPSLHEGLPLVGIEAQASGLPFFFSDVIPEEVNALPELARPLPLSLPASGWAERILAVRNRPPKLSQEEALRRMKDGPFNIHHAVRRLEEVYGQRPAE